MTHYILKCQKYDSNIHPISSLNNFEAPSLGQSQNPSSSSTLERLLGTINNYSYFYTLTVRS